MKPPSIVLSIVKYLQQPKRMLVLGTLGFMGLTGWGWQQQAVKAQEQVATGTDWQQASFPVENFQEYTSPFGPRGSGFHYGLDLAAPYGSYIRNWWAGQITDVWEDGRCGVGIAVKSGPWEHIYCHVQGTVGRENGQDYLMDREGGILLQKGQMIPAGARIARVGMTGNTSGPHLHWVLKYSGQWVDPALVLREMYSQQARRG